MPHLLDTYALQCGLKHSKPQINESFFPVASEKYITVHNSKKTPAKEYDYFNSVIEILKPILQKEGIDIVQIGDKNDAIMPGTISLNGQTTIRQTSFVIKNALLHLGVDSAPVHIASTYNKKIVGLYGNSNFVKVVRPYWSKDEDVILLESENLNNQKPSFSLQEPVKTINTIKPEKIAEAVCKLLNIEFVFPFETVQFGIFYNHPKMIEMVPNVAINTQAMGLQNIIIRMDYEFNEQILVNQLSVGNATIITNKTINLDILKNFKSRISQFVYVVERDNDPVFVNQVQKMGINVAIISTLSDEELNPYKLQWLDVGLINRKTNLTAIKDTVFYNIPKEKLYYKTNKITLGRQKIYPSKAAYLQNLTVDNANPNFLPLIDHPEWYSEIDYFHIVKLKD